MVTPTRTSLILGYLIGLIAFVAPILGFVAPKGLAPLVIAGGVIGILILKSQKRAIKWLNRPVIVILALLCGLAFISSFWAIESHSALVGTAKLMGNFVVGGLLLSVVQSLNNAEKKRASRWLLAGFVVVLAALALELVLGSPLYHALKGIDPEKYKGGAFWLNSIAVVLALLVWPLALLALKKNILRQTSKSTALFIFCGFAFVLILLIQIEFSSGMLAFLCGLLGAGVIWLFGRKAAIGAASLLVLIGLALPFGFNAVENPVVQLRSYLSLPSSAEHRIRIWEFTAEKIAQKKLAGWGFNASKLMPDGKTKLFSMAGAQYGDALPLHPHNAILQLWLELGVPGILLYLSLAVYILMLAVRRYRSKFEAAMIFGQFSTAMIIANLSFGVWQAWWIATLWLSASLMVLAVKHDSDPGTG